MNKKLLTLLLVLGGFMIFSLNGFKQHTEQKQQHQLEVSIAKLIVSDYEDIETIEFQGWGHSRETGMWGTTVIVNGSDWMSFSFSGLSSLEELRGTRYNLDRFNLVEKSETVTQRQILNRINGIGSISLEGVSVVYSREIERK